MMHTKLETDEYEYVILWVQIEHNPLSKTKPMLLFSHRQSETLERGAALPSSLFVDADTTTTTNTANTTSTTTANSDTDEWSKWTRDLRSNVEGSVPNPPRPHYRSKVTATKRIHSMVWGRKAHINEFVSKHPFELITDAAVRLNDASMPLFKLTYINSEMKSVNLLSAFLYEQTNANLYWLWGKAVPAIIGKTACARVEQIVGDNDNQQKRVIESLKREIYTSISYYNIDHWHHINLHANQHCAPLLSTKTAKERGLKIVITWLHTLVRANTWSEYKTRKDRLFE